MNSHNCDSSEDEYEEGNEELLDMQCLFCSEHFPSFEGTFSHITAEHGLDFVGTCKGSGKVYNTIQFIKLVNYIRTKAVKAGDVETVIISNAYDRDDYLKPSLEDDHLLMFASTAEQIADLETHYKGASKEAVIADLLQLKSRYEALKTLSGEMKQFIQGSIAADDQSTATGTTNTQDQGLRSSDLAADADYISSYAHFGIHHVMLSDRARTLAYKDAILENAEQFKGKTVLDIGCGTGILSLFAAKAGASLVVAVDQSDIVYNAMDIVRLNGYEAVIRPVKGRLESLDFAALGLPTTYDFIVSEWMGYFLLFEGMLDTVLFARDRFLKPDTGLLLPNRSKLFLAAFSDAAFYERHIDFWHDVYGFKMTTMIGDVVGEAAVDCLAEGTVVSSAETIAELDIARCSLADVTTITSRVLELKFEKAATVHGLIGWFDVYFDALCRTVVLSTSPFAEEPTHWKQTIFLLAEPISVEAGKTLEIEVTVTRDRVSNGRGLVVQMMLLNQGGGNRRRLEYSISC
ncbi:Protein arginine N-methyltransferase 3 [Tyrophagus putrescentiae]|nr:Protein arginine N-methyltransferase 3 [Tyrophagus putrescentiae]